MIRRVLVWGSLCVLAVSVPCVALQLVTGRRPAVAAAGDTCTTATAAACFNFDSTGAPSAAWSGTANPDSTNSPLEGTQDVALDINETYTYDPNYNAAEQYWTMHIRIEETVEGNTAFFLVRDSAGNTLGNAAINGATNQLRCGAQGGTVSNGGTATAYSTTGLKVRVRFVQGTGSNATIQGWIWSGSAWGGAACSSINGTTTAAIDNVQLFNNSDGAPEIVHIDYLKTDNSAITTPD